MLSDRGHEIAASGRLVATDALDNRFDNPSEELLWQIISGLTASDNYFVMVQHVPDSSKDGTYIQTAVLPDGRFTVEYRAYDVVVAWAFRRPEWREMLAWEPDY